MIDVVELSRLQFALTAMFHFLFVPLTIGMSCLLAIMESIYVLTGKQIYQDMTRFLGQALWNKLCVRCDDGFNHGVSVWNQLVLLFTLCWRYFWCSVSD